MSETNELEIFYDYICPWCYLGTLNTDRLHREFGIELRYTLFPLHPEIPIEGIELSSLFRGRPLDAMKGKLKDAAAKAGLAIAPRSRISNSRRAQELEKWAMSNGKGDEFRTATFRAYFGEGLDIALIPVLSGIAESIGLDKKEVETVLEEGRFADAVDADWLRAREFAIMSVPFYLYGEEPLVGYRPFEDFVQLIGKS
jgi:predicted DsbA family dithiol-disulfide isomerase